MTDPRPPSHSKFAFDGLAKLDPGREQRLMHFLSSPIDSRESDSMAPRLFVSGTSIGGPSSKQILDREWDARFSRVYGAFKVDPRKRERSASASLGPTLVQRQISVMPDPLNCQAIEEIVEARSTAVQGPVLQLSKLPKLRCLPKEILQNPIRRSRHVE
jgi:hypothetical protein